MDPQKLEIMNVTKDCFYQANTKLYNSDYVKSLVFKTCEWRKGTGK